MCLDLIHRRNSRRTYVSSPWICTDTYQDGLRADIIAGVSLLKSERSEAVNEHRCPNK